MAADRVIAKVDRGLVAVLLLIASLGIYNLSSAGRNVSENLYVAQAAYFALGLVLMTAAASIDYRNFEGLAFPFYALVVGLLMLTLSIGRVVNGSRRWLDLGPVGLQASDLAKIAVVMMMAKMLHLEKREGARLSLSEVMRPMNISRPLVAVLAMLAVTMAGDGVKPPELKQRAGSRSRTVGKLRGKTPVLTVGRTPENSVVLPFSGLEPRHAEVIRIEDGNYLIRDLGSAAGTYVNGERVDGARRLHDGDLIRFGLSPRSEISFSAPLERFRPFRTLAAVGALLWLMAAMILQFTKRGISQRDVLAPIDPVIPPVVLILVQPDLGTAMVVLVVAMTMILYVGLAPLSFLALTVIGSGSVGFAWLFLLKPYQKERVLNFLDPEADLSGAGYHQHQSLIAMGSGGFWGKGHGQGTQTQLSFLPEQQTDFIFSVWGEEHGFIGCAIVVVLFAALILLALRSSVLAKDRFGALLGIGMTSILFWHALTNMLMVLRLAPVVGVPLPFFSYGGSFMLTAMVAIGVILNVGIRRYVF